MKRFFETFKGGSKTTQQTEIILNPIDIEFQHQLDSASTIVRQTSLAVSGLMDRFISHYKNPQHEISSHGKHQNNLGFSYISSILALLPELRTFHSQLILHPLSTHTFLEILSYRYSLQLTGNSTSTVLTENRWKDLILYHHGDIDRVCSMVSSSAYSSSANTIVSLAELQRSKIDKKDESSQGGSQVVSLLQSPSMSNSKGSSLQYNNDSLSQSQSEFSQDGIGEEEFTPFQRFLTTQSNYLKLFIPYYFRSETYKETQRLKKLRYGNGKTFGQENDHNVNNIGQNDEQNEQNMATFTTDDFDFTDLDNLPARSRTAKLTTPNTNSATKNAQNVQNMDQKTQNSLQNPQNSKPTPQSPLSSASMSKNQLPNILKRTLPVHTDPTFESPLSPHTVCSVFELILLLCTKTPLVPSEATLESIMNNNTPDSSDIGTGISDVNNIGEQNNPQNNPQNNNNFTQKKHHKK